MAKPRSKILRKVSGKPNAEIQKVLDIQAQKRRYSSWGQADADAAERELRCTATATNPCALPCGNPSCEKYSVLYDPYYSPPQWSLLMKGIPTDSTGKLSDIPSDLPYLIAGDGTHLVVEDVAPVAQAEAIVTFTSFHHFAIARRSKVLSYSNLLFNVQILPFVSKMLMDRLEDMVDYDQTLDIIDQDDDPLVGAALVPGLRRSDFTKPIDIHGLRFNVSETEKARLRAILGSAS